MQLSEPDKQQLINGLLRLVEQPTEFGAIYGVDAVLRRTELSAIACATLKAEPAVAAIIEARYVAPTPNLDQLLTYAPASLGYQYAAHLKANQFDPVFYPQQSCDSDISYIALRRSQTHDIQHVITGFGTDLAGEVGLQAFQLAQTRSPLAIALVAINLAAALDQPTLLGQIMAQWHQGWEMGLRARPLLAQRWEEAWEKPVAAWRAELQIGALPGS
jgi:ubiquinone biosynthesis protein COQ4